MISQSTLKIAVRVLYEVKENVVFLLAVGHRKHIYEWEIINCDLVFSTFATKSSGLLGVIT